MLSKNQNVKIESSSEYVKVTNLQNFGNPGVKILLNCKKNDNYTLITNGYKVTQNNYSKISINIPFSEKYFLSNYNKKYIIKFNTHNNEKIYINILFEDCEIDDYFILYSLKIFDSSMSPPILKEPTRLAKSVNSNLEEPILKEPTRLTKPIISESVIKKEIPGDKILIIVDYIYMKNNLAASRYKFLNYLAERNKNIIIVGTGMPNFQSGMSIYTLTKKLGIQPKIIIHANNFMKNKLLVTGLLTYKCKKILIVEDMHNTDLITYLVKTNGINYIFYHCNCNQLDRLKLLNRNQRFIDYPHYIDTRIFKNYRAKKTHDIILYGCTNPAVYPFRYRLYNLINRCKKFRILYIPFPGYFIKNNRSITTGKKLAKMINKAYIGIVTPSIHDYFLKKYMEIPACYTMVAGNIPTRYRNILGGNVIELTPKMSDVQIISILQAELKNKKELMEKIDKLHNLIINNFSYECGNNNFNKIIEAIDKVN